MMPNTKEKIIIEVKTVVDRHNVYINGKMFLSYMDYVEACLVSEAIQQYDRVIDYYRNGEQQ